MGIWDIYCCVCGGPATLFDTSDLDFDPSEHVDTKNLISAITKAKSWITEWVGIDPEERLHALRDYDMYGSFRTSDKKIFESAATFNIAYSRPDVLHGITCHSACHKFLWQRLNYDLSFEDVFELIRKNDQLPRELSGSYMQMSLYQSQLFDWIKLANNKDTWLVCDPNKNARNASRILTIWRPLIKDSAIRRMRSKKGGANQRISRRKRRKSSTKYL